VGEHRTGRLVRDRIPELLRAAGDDPRTSVLGDEEYDLALQARLHEEIAKMVAASDDRRTEALADVLEVLYALAEYHGLDWDTVEHVGLTRRHEKGGFEGRVWLES
jgi:predicted house-cleaning noncanonical NTP pyrophosphatase (MazG superfamily)